MSVRSAILYIESKYVHEMCRDNYHMDMLRLTASAYMKEPPQRYFDLLYPKHNRQESRREKSGEEILTELLQS